MLPRDQPLTPLRHPNLRQGAKSEARNRFLGVFLLMNGKFQDTQVYQRINPYTQRRPRRNVKQASFYGKYH